MERDPAIVDTDGDVTQMVPWLLREGIDGVLPLERQAGVDGMAIRRQFPEFCMVGHFNKMVMDKGEQAIRDEFERLMPLMKSGGFIPSVDHQTPPGVSLDQYKTYLRILREYARARRLLLTVLATSEICMTNASTASNEKTGYWESRVALQNHLKASSEDKRNIVTMPRMKYK